MQQHQQQQQQQQNTKSFERLRDKKDDEEIDHQGYSDGFDDFENFDNQSWGNDDDFDNSGSSHQKHEAKIETLVEQKNNENKRSEPPSRPSAKAKVVKGSGMSLKSKTTLSVKKPVVEDENQTSTVANQLDSKTTSNNSNVKKPQPKTDLGDEFSIKIKETDVVSKEPDYFADMMPDFKDTSKITKTVLIERKDDLSTKFQVTSATVEDINMVIFSR